jgi:hypothetical protein
MAAGAIYAFGQWRDDSRAKLDDLARTGRAPTRQAVAAAVRQSGAPFCATAQPSWISMNRALGREMSASLVARAAPFNGFGDGHPANMQCSKDCPPAVRMSRHRPAAGQRPEETVVLMVARN